jgi:hypothetical protein
MTNARSPCVGLRHEVAAVERDDVAFQRARFAHERRHHGITGQRLCPERESNPHAPKGRRV